MTGLCNISRRGFLASGAVLGGGLILANLLPASSEASEPSESRIGSVVRVAADGRVSILVERCEMGQGVYTSLPTLVAEELEVDWRDVTVEALVLAGPWRKISTAGSTSVRTQWEPLRRAGATARVMLIAAAARRWGVDARECHAEAGRVIHGPSGRVSPYAELAEDAAALPAPTEVPLKDPRDFRLIGQSLPRLDVPDKVDGSAIFGIDVVVPDMLYAAIRMSPVFGGVLASTQEAAALAVRGVRAVVPLGNAVAVVAERFWQAEKGLEALAPVFEGGDADMDSAAYSLRLQQALDGVGVTLDLRGDPDGVLARAARVIDARYEVPFLAHATMEPMNCTAKVDREGCDLWAPTQAPTRLRDAVAAALDLPLERVRVHVPLLGGGFGRRYEEDVGLQAARVARAVGRPVKLIWSREQDIRHDFYRPAYAIRMQAALDSKGDPEALGLHVAGPRYWTRDVAPWLRRAVDQLQAAIGSGLIPEALPDALEYRFPRWVRSAGDGLAMGGTDDLGYRLPHQRCAFSSVDCLVPIGWWRSVSGSQNAFFTESFLDELAHAAGRDPFEYRRALMESGSRQRRVLEHAAEAAGWGSPPPPGRGRGIAFYRFAGTSVCQVAEVSLPSREQLRVERVVCAVDCGRVIHPEIVRSQIESAIVFGLNAALYGEITLKNGAVEQSNFHDYPLLQLAEMPAIEVHILPSEEEPSGIGEPGTPPIAPAVANAIFALSGRRLRRLPFRRALAEA